MTYFMYFLIGCMVGSVAMMVFACLAVSGIEEEEDDLKDIREWLGDNDDESRGRGLSKKS